VLMAITMTLTRTVVIAVRAAAVPQNAVAVAA
jgi:hypothetical protein